MTSSLPEIVYCEKRRHLLFITIHVFVEDRRPDLSYEQARTELGYKWKYFVEVYVFGKRIFFYSVTSLTAPGIIEYDMVSSTEGSPS